MNNKGQFSIIAALLVAVVLIASVVTTYSAIRYSAVESQPQILSAVDETNLGLKQILGFTVGYYGSVLQVTGNSSYAQTLATNYLDSGLENVADIRPEWGASFNVTSLSLSTNWFTNESYSQGNLNITYDLTGLGIYGIAYSTSCRLDVKIAPFSSNNQASITVVKDENEPVVGLSASSFKFYLYQYSNLSWAMTTPLDDPVSSSDGTYIIDVPSEINPQSFAIQVQDSRGIAVAASSFSHYTGSLMFNTTTLIGGDYVNQHNSSVDSIPDQGTHSNFPAQQQGPDGIFDTLTEANVGTTGLSYNPTTYILDGSTTLVSGSPSNLAHDDGVYMTFGSYGTGSSAQTLYAHKETTTISGAIYNDSLLSSADSSGVTLTGSMANSRTLLDKSVFSLQGISTIPASTWTMYYRASKTDQKYPHATGHIDVDILIRQSNGAMRSTIAAGVAASTNLATSVATLSGTYSFATYTIVNPTDYLEIDYYVDSSTTGSSTANLIIDNNALALTDQTRAKNVMLPSQYTCQAELSGTSNLNNWNNILWAIDASSTVGNVNAVFQLYNYVSGQYPSSGDGYLSTTLGTTVTPSNQNIASNPTQFRDAIGTWKIRFTVTAPTAVSFNINVDSCTFTTGVAAYELSLEEQWTNLNYTGQLHPTLCIDTGTMSSDNLAVDVWRTGAWQPLDPALVNGWNNMSVNSYLDTGSTNLTIRFRSSDTGDTVQSSWQVDAALIRPESDQELIMSLQNPAATVAVELLQNGTMRWLGQNLQLTTQAVPVPPVPVKAIHVNETIDGVNQQVPFQIEDWASSYTVPLGLTSNSTVFGNRQMIVFLVNTHVSDFTLWWNGSDQATQTPLAYTNTYFTGDNPSGHTLTNGNITLSVTDVSKFTVTSTVGSSTSTASFMRINNQASTYGAGEAYVIHHGVVRDIIQQEAEWSNGVTNCPNLYANIVLTLPANATYFTYQLNLMFINSTQTRTITNLCPINMTSTAGQLQTENGTLNGDPVVASGTQTFSNSTGTWAHHWSQFTDGTNGAGIMFTDQANQMLYTFDAPTISRGSIVANSTAQTISLLPVTLNSVSFQTALDVTWYGAVATFDGSAPPIYSGYGQPGLWILAELPPTITIDIEN